jgi:4-amino-4-deoxy-L-arabinose transferase-like glycosyltransferase
MDDVDAVQAQIARNMLQSGDWVTARLDGVAYLEKPPLKYWTMAVSYRIFGVYDWAARLPVALSVVLLCFVMYRFARWAFDEEAGLYAGLILATCVGLFLFTRILIPDAMLTLTITGAIWAGLRLLEPDGENVRQLQAKSKACWGPGRRWALLLGACLGAGLLLKGLIALVFPIAAGLAYMAVAGQLFSLAAWRKLHLGMVVLAAAAVAVPWHVLATLANPPYLAFSLHSGPGEYRGFFWFYFFNEHLLRFLNLRYPHDYNTVPRYLFWLLTLAWMFPWSAYLLGVPGLSFRPTPADATTASAGGPGSTTPADATAASAGGPGSRAARVRLMALCWFAAVMLFFTLSTTQEYYSMPMYPALALLIASALSAGGKWVRVASRVMAGVFAILCCGLAVLLALAWRLPAKGDISQALTQNPELYTLSMGHMADLTLNAFAYLKLPLALAAAAFGVCALGIVLMRGHVRRTVLVLAAGMVIFFQAAHIALMRFDGYLGSYPLAQALEQSPPGQLIEADAYYAFSSVFFYTNRRALLLNGRVNNLEYGSYAPGAPKVFIGDGKFSRLWAERQRCYLLAFDDTELTRLRQLVGAANLHVVAENSGKYLFTNHPL